MKTIKSFLFVMFMLLASNAMANQILGEVNESEPVEGAAAGNVMGYSQVTIVDNENVIGVSEWPSSVADVPYFAISGQTNLTLSGGYAGGRYTVFGWKGSAEDPRLEYLIDLGNYNYSYDWSVEGMGTRCYVSGFGRCADVSIYSDTHGSIRVVCNISSSTGGSLGTAIGYIYF